LGSYLIELLNPNCTAGYESQFISILIVTIPSIAIKPDTSTNPKLKFQTQFQQHAINTHDMLKATKATLT
jgi:hypothetical protein